MDYLLAQSDTLTQVGVGGVMAILVLKEVFSFVGKKNNCNHQDDASEMVKRSEFEKHKDSVQYKDNCRLTVRRFDDLFQAQEKRFDKVDTHLDELKTLVKNGGNG